MREEESIFEVVLLVERGSEVRGNESEMLFVWLSCEEWMIEKRCKKKKTKKSMLLCNSDTAIGECEFVCLCFKFWFASCYIYIEKRHEPKGMNGAKKEREE